MPVSSILDHTSFARLDKAGQAAVRKLFDKVYQSYDLDKKPAREQSELFNKRKTLAGSLDFNELFYERKSLAVSLDFYGSRLDEINPASFKFLTRQQRLALHNELLFAFYIFSAQYQLDESEHRRQDLKARGEQIKKCADLINELRMSTRKNSPQLVLDRAINDSEKHAKYLGLTLVAPLLSETMVDLSLGVNKTGTIKSAMGAVNERRLYWVWANSMLSSVFSLLPNDFANNQQAQRTVGRLSPVTGYMSWILYYTRFGINLSLLMKHTIAGPWMSEKEREIPAWDRFKTQWDQRKFSLLNDSIWATANMACFLWLIGSGTLGYLGNVTTAVLLLMDVSLTAWRFAEEETEHKRIMLRYTRDIEALVEAHQDEKNAEKKQVLDLQLAALLKAEKQCQLDWDYKKSGLVYDLAYATSLLVAFCVMCCFLFPPAMIAPATALILGLVGGAMCFVLNTIYAAMSSGLVISKAGEKSDLAKYECNRILQVFTDTKDERIKKQLYLDMKQLLAESEHQERLAHFQKLKLIYSVMIDVLIPPLVFASFMFLPLGIGLGVLAAGIALALIAHKILKQYEPLALKLPSLDDPVMAAEYERVANLPAPTLADISPEKKSKPHEKPGFFCKGESVRIGYDLDSASELGK